ncbi:uncharacterized protein [Zea mays]|uniref:Uncharacterized protein n=1 Tax=Zea mays TaxID=4577 RepID=A0A1D6HF97_MAIZE|nr:uncharacterized protein LOC118471964 [Zea mays]AQK73317.1 hypothetical protein ZEAMMB73_Zm00001d017506 [Zea mays]
MASPVVADLPRRPLLLGRHSPHSLPVGCAGEGVRACVRAGGWTGICCWVGRGMALFAVSGARLGVVRPGGSTRSGGERRSAVDLPSLLFRRKDAFSRTVLSCAGAPGKVLVPGGGSDDLLSSAEPVVDTQPEELQI